MPPKLAAIPPPGPLLVLPLIMLRSVTVTLPRPTTMPPLYIPTVWLSLTWLAEMVTLPVVMAAMPPPPKSPDETDTTAVDELPLTVLPPLTSTASSPGRATAPTRMPPTSRAEFPSTWLPPPTRTEPVTTSMPPPRPCGAWLELTELPSSETLPAFTTTPPPSVPATLPATLLVVSVSPLPAQTPPPWLVAALGEAAVPTTLWSSTTWPGE
jgi:hypothetical protein